MKARYKVAIGIAGLAVVGGVLTPRLVFGQQPLIANHDGILDKIVTKQFEDVNVNEVFAWLVGQGFSFVVDDREFDQARVTMDIDHKTLGEAANSLASALGGRWEKKGAVYVFRRDEPLGYLSADSANGGEAWIPSSEPLKWLPTADAAQTPGQGMDPKQSEEFSKGMEKWAQQFADQMKNFKFDFPNTQGYGDGSKMTPEQKRAFEKKWEDWGQKFGAQFKNFKFGFPNMKGFDADKMTPEQKKAFEKKWEDWGNKFSEQFKDFKFDMPDMKGFEYSDGDSKMSPEQRKAFEKKMQDWGEQFGSQMKNFNFSVPNMPNFNYQWKGDGMNPEQEKAFEKQMKDWGDNFGKEMKQYNFKSDQHDLTPEQRRVLEKNMKELEKNLHQQFGNGNFPFKGKDWQNFGDNWAKWGQQFGKGFGDGSGRLPTPPTEDGDSDGPTVDHVHVQRAEGGSEDLKSLLQSLSSSQRETQTSRGYLTPSDLTEEQRGYFHVPSGDNWVLKFTLDGNSVEIRSH